MRIRQSSVCGVLGIGVDTLRKLRADHLVEGVDWGVDGRLALYQDYAVEKLKRVLGLDGPINAPAEKGVLETDSSEKSGQGQVAAQNVGLKTVPLIVRDNVRRILNPRLVEVYYADEPSVVFYLWIRPNMKEKFRPRQFIPPEHVRPRGDGERNLCYIAAMPPRRSIDPARWREFVAARGPCPEGPPGASAGPGSGEKSQRAAP